MKTMNKPKLKINQAQSIIEYLLVLIVVVLGITVGSIFFKQGVKNGLEQAQEHLQATLPQTVDSTHQAEVKTFDLTYTGGENTGGTD